MQKREKEEMLMRTLTEDDLAHIYGGANGGNQNSSGTTSMPSLSDFLPKGMSLPYMPDLSKMPSSSSGNNQSTVPGPSNGSSGGSGGGLGSLLPLGSLLGGGL
ncbi:MAG TPA: bacteriocin [Ktedonobacteraceae bacterium]|nr:bacteriocin [Ktedonobacteraceae bacterium]